MSYQAGWAALNLEFTDRVPRTEYSAEMHWDLIRAVTGIEVNETSDWPTKNRASFEFVKKWNYDFKWNVLTGGNIFGEKRTRMGHAVYAAGGTDYNNRISYGFSGVEEILNLDMDETYGIPDHNTLVEQYNKHYEDQKKYEEHMVTMTGVYVTCISGLIDLFGWEMLLDALGTDPEGFGEVTNRYCKWIQRYFNALADSKAPVVMVHDDIVWTEGPFAHPDWYRKYLFPNYKNMLAPLREAGKKIIYTSDGTYTEFVDDIAPYVNGFVLEPTTDLGYIAEHYGRTHAFIGNADTRVLLLGSKEDIYQEVKRCMDIGKKYPGFFMCVGNHIPPNTPVDNALWYEECYEKLSKR